MFAWLTSLFSGKSQRANASGSASLVHAVSSGASTRTPRASVRRASPPSPPATPARSADEPYIDTLAREVGALTALTPFQEQSTSLLVEAVSSYVGTHAIDPPVMPALASRMLELLRADEVDVVALSRLIEKDQATAAKLMSIANSALYKGNTEVQGVRDAVVFLGTEQVAQIAIGLASRAMFEAPVDRRNAVGAERFQRLFNHAMTTAFAACHLATQRSRRHSEAAFLGGLFHDVGKAVALRAIHDMVRAKQIEQPSEVVVDAALQQIHGEPTAALYQSWKLPRQLMSMCQNHHRLALDTVPELHFVRLASGLDALRTGADVDKREALQEIGESAAALKLNDAQVRVANTETHAFGERVLHMFG